MTNLNDLNPSDIIQEQTLEEHFEEQVSQA